MITARIERGAPKTFVREVTISGHAGYDDYGKDIVCSAVSSVSINIINAARALLDVPLETEQSDGKIVCRIPHLEDRDQAERVQLLMETLVFSLKAIAEEYPSFVSVQER